MTSRIFKGSLALAALPALIVQPAMAQTPSIDEMYTVTQAKIAPGKYEEALRAQALIERVRAEAGLEPAMMYMHFQGANWDLLLIYPPAVDDEDKRMEAAARRLGVELPGPFANHALWSGHQDTVVFGPTTAAEALADIYDD
ncbi:MAG: hypothetical protein ABJM58_01450 [Alteripontixanthobacter sp.]